MRPGRLLALTVAAWLAGPAAAGAAVELAAPATFSPNGDGVKDEAALSVRLDGPATVTVEVRSEAGAVLATLAAGEAFPAGLTRLSWDGTLDSGRRARDGLYAVGVRALDEAGGSADAGALLRVDTKAPRAGWLSAPGRAGKGAVRLRYRVADGGTTARVTLLLEAQSGARWRAGTRSTPVGAHTASWALRAKGGGPAVPGAYRLELEVRDEAGNRGVSAARPLLVSYPVKTRVVRRLDGAGRRVALTFDDCNEGDAWSRILDALAAAGAKASFFCLGTEVAEHAAQVRRTVRERHSVGNHTWNHKLLPSLAYDDVRRQLAWTEGPWWRLAKASPAPYLRPPYGALDAETLAAVGDAGYPRTVLWDVDPQDWRRPGAPVIAERAVAPARAGSIILLHVIAQTADALPAIIAGLRGKGLAPVSLDELFRAPGSR